MVLTFPWPKGAQTLRTSVARDHCDFGVEQARCLRLVEQLAAKPLDGQWPAHPQLGAMTGTDMSRLQAKHLDHHLKQFGAAAALLVPVAGGRLTAQLITQTNANAPLTFEVASVKQNKSGQPLGTLRVQTGGLLVAIDRIELPTQD